jgi:hypothetical protein
MIILVRVCNISHWCVLFLFSAQDWRLPSYDEVRDMPKDPPAYEALFEGGDGLLSTVQQNATHLPERSQSLHCTVPVPCSTSVGSCTVAVADG